VGLKYISFQTHINCENRISRIVAVKTRVHGMIDSHDWHHHQQIQQQSIAAPSHASTSNNNLAIVMYLSTYHPTELLYF